MQIGQRGLRSGSSPTRSGPGPAAHVTAFTAFGGVSPIDQIVVTARPPPARPRASCPCARLGVGPLRRRRRPRPGAAGNQRRRPHEQTARACAGVFQIQIPRLIVAMRAEIVRWTVNARVGETGAAALAVAGSSVRRSACRRMPSRLVVANPFVSATSGGDPYSVPLVIDTNPAPNIVETTITAEEATVDIGNGVTAHAQTFNGADPGPDLRAQRRRHGDRPLRQPPQAGQRHPLARDRAGQQHGRHPVHAEPGAAGRHLPLQVHGHRPGIFWYHPHHHSSTNQVFKGLYGMIVVKDPNEAALQASGVLPPANPDQADRAQRHHRLQGAGHATTRRPTTRRCPHVSRRPPCRRSRADAEEPLRGPDVEPGRVTTPIRSTRTATRAGRSRRATSPTSRRPRHAGARERGPDRAHQRQERRRPRGGPPRSRRARSPPAPRRSTCSPGQGLRLQLVNASAIRYMRLQPDRRRRDAASR